ncbi:outer membrane protein assembly factor BamC [Niveibacterium sp. SC-1]|uniref:outer membrane protein assembly factor BamC n=1 Tax=Niveibacterium sp. SC-1 TaxID=3135646 RepID=UPI00311D6A99
MRTMRTAASLCLLLAASACSTDSLNDMGKVDYKSASKQRAQPLEVPPDLTRPGRDERYSFDGETSAANLSDYQTGSGKSVRSGNEVLPNVNDMTIGRAGNERWLVVQATPEQIWPKVRQFWQDNGYPIVVERPDVGVMETDWVENRGKISQDFIRNAIGKVWDGLYTSPEKDRFRTRIEPGAKPGTVEVYVAHRGLEEVLTGAQKDSSTWTWRPTDPGLESEMLRRMMLSLGVSEDRANSLLANVEPTERARFERAPDGGAALVFAAGFDQAWRQIGQALDRTGFLVEDRDRTLGLYDVSGTKLEQTTAEPKSQSLWSKLKFWGDSQPDAPAQVVLSKGASYRVFVKGDDKRSTVRVLDVQGNIDKSEEANKILKLLFDQIK